MDLTDYVVAVRRSNNRPVTAVKKAFKDEFLKAWKPVGVELRDITDYVTSEDLLGQVQEFIENVMGYEFEGRSQKDEYVVEIYMGDWKHDHQNLDELMKGVFNMHIINSEVLDDGDGGDCYSARRFYKIRKEKQFITRKGK